MKIIKETIATLKRMDGWLVLRNGSGLTSKEKQIVATIEEALAQPAQEQEPVAWMLIQGRHEELSHWPLDDGEISRGWEQYPLYTTPPQLKERNFCPRCGKRTADLTVIHTCTPPQEKNT